MPQVSGSSDRQYEVFDGRWHTCKKAKLIPCLHASSADLQSRWDAVFCGAERKGLTVHSRQNASKR